MNKGKLGEEMELRKVIKFGRATYSITLPKQWVTKQKIQKGDVLRIEQTNAGNLEVHPNSKSPEQEVKSVDIKADKKSAEDIFREVVGAYIKNYTIINIVGDISGKIKELRYLLQELVGLEIMEVSPKKIITKNFLDITQTKVGHTMKRTYYILKNMSEFFKNVLTDGTEVEEILEMDREVNKNTFFSMKCLFNCLDNPHSKNECCTNKYEILLNWEMVQMMEKTADKIKRMADIAQNKKVLTTPNAKKKFLELYEEVEKDLFNASEEFFKKNKENVHGIFKKVEENEERCNAAIQDYKEGWTPLLIDYLKDINQGVRAIAEILVDFD